MKRNVLVIADLNQAVPRMPQILKYLPVYGWDPIVLTPYTYLGVNADFEIIKTNYKHNFALLRKILGLDLSDSLNKTIVKEKLNITSNNSLFDPLIAGFGAIFNYPDSDKGWIPFALETGRVILQERDIDALISCSSPVSGHIIASTLKKEFEIPWIADLRDLWSQNHDYGYGPIRQRIDKRLELKTLKSADLLTTVSFPWAKRLKELHQRDSVKVITNGFDPKILEMPLSTLSDKFLMTYSGRFYEGRQSPSKFFEALHDLISQGFISPKDIAVNFYGSNHLWIDKEIKKFGLGDIVTQYSWIPRDTAIEKERESQVLLLFNWENPYENGWPPLKIFGYMAAQRPILAIGGNKSDVIQCLLKETNSGYYVSTVDEVKKHIKLLYSEFKLRGEIRTEGNLDAIKRYRYSEKAKEFAFLLNGL
jgi:hypothetical protein